MGVPAVPLGELYAENIWKRIPQVRIEHRAPVQQVRIENGRVIGVIVGGRCETADAYVLAVPFERLPTLARELPVDVASLSHSPITGIHLWFERSITDLPHATLLDRTIQWMFNKGKGQGGKGQHIQLVVSASRSLTDLPRNEVIELALNELKEFFPQAANAQLERAHVVKEIRATFCASPEIESHRPANATSVSNLFLAGDWTRSGWPATMEGAVRSGYLAAEAVLASFGESWKFLLPDLA
jgi:zeta-carotene desaturase